MKKRRKPSMLIPTLIMAGIALILLIVGYLRGNQEHMQGIKFAGSMTLVILPLLFFSFIIAGMLKALISDEMLSAWLGTQSGMKGILIGTVAGSLIQGGPYVAIPVAAGLLRAGSGAGTVVAFLTGWSVWALSRLPMELGILGPKFTLIRYGCTFFFPILAGLLAAFMETSLKIHW